MLFIAPPVPPPIAVPVRPIGIPSGMRFLSLRGTLVNIFDECSSADPNIRYVSRAFNARFGQFQIQVTDPPLPGVFVAYCLAANLAAPPVGSPLRTADAYAILNTLTELQINRLVWTILNAYPAISAQTLFERAGVDWQASPPLVDYDAFAATQLALWNTQTDQRAFSVQNCGQSIDHIKNPRISAIVQYLVDTAAIEGNTLPAAPVVTMAPENVTVAQTPQGTLVGPYALTSNQTQPITMTADGMAVIVDIHGTPVTVLQPGANFYVRFPRSTNSLCSTVTAALVTTAVTPVVFAALDDDGQLLEDTQQLGAVLLEADSTTAEDALHICVSNCGECPECKPGCNTRIFRPVSCRTHCVCLCTRCGRCC